MLLWCFSNCASFVWVACASIWPICWWLRPCWVTTCTEIFLSISSIHLPDGVKKRSRQLCTTRTPDTSFSRWSYYNSCCDGCIAFSSMRCFFRLSLLDIDRCSLVSWLRFSTLGWVLNGATEFRNRRCHTHVYTRKNILNHKIISRKTLIDTSWFIFPAFFWLYRLFLRTPLSHQIFLKNLFCHSKFDRIQGKKKYFQENLDQI